MECGFQGPWPIMAQVAQGKLSSFLTLSECLACLLGCEVGMVCKAFPTLKLNGGFLFFERLTGSPQASLEPSVLPQGWKIGKQFLSKGVLQALEDIISTLHIQDTDGEEH